MKWLQELDLSTLLRQRRAGDERNRGAFALKGVDRKSEEEKSVLNIIKFFPFWEGKKKGVLWCFCCSAGRITWS